MKNLTLLIFLFSVFIGQSQVDFNNYITIQSVGAIPEDFTSLTYNKLKDDLQNGDSELNPYEKKVFYEGINYAIDDILHSGYVTYGDEISEYINDIANKLLRKDKKLRSELRFYTLKSTASNAFSTDQGIVFVTTGLIAQLTSEAQLAYILAHEISHYTEKHVVETFSFKSDNRRQTLEQMSVYSKDKEFEADKIGLELYQKAGYSKDEVLPTFDVLMYSYLPFDEVDISADYFFVNDSIYIPTSIFPEEKFEIKAEEDEDDSRSSHPNIKKRKDAVIIEFDELSEGRWKTDVNKLGEERFLHVRNLARFENVRSDVAEAKYANALYSIYILESEYPESMFLKRMKAQAWLGLLMYRLENEISHTIDRKSDYEGAVASVHYMIRNFRKDELEAFALLQLYELVKTNAQDAEISLIWDFALKTVVEKDNFELSDFSHQSYYVAKEKYNKSLVDTLKVTTSDTVSKKKSKYDRIKKKRSLDAPESFDSTKFYKYILHQMIDDENFTDKYEALRDELKEREKEEEDLDKLPYNEQKKVYAQQELDRLKLGIDDLIVVEPTVLSYKSNGVDRVKSEKMEKMFSEAILEASDDVGMNIYSIDKNSLEKEGTHGFNERSTLLNMVGQLFVNEDVEPFPVDYQLLQEIQNNYGTSKVMFSLVENGYHANISFVGAFSSIVFFPIGMVYFPIAFMTGNNTEMNLIILDIEKASIIAGESHFVKDSARKHIIGAHLYSIFSQLKMK